MDHAEKDVMTSQIIDVRAVPLGTATPTTALNRLHPTGSHRVPVAAFGSSI